jgi:FkbM family methyltransferase
VNVVGVNDLFRIYSIEKCDLLKMDCEGSELAILTALWQFQSTLAQMPIRQG